MITSMSSPLSFPSMCPLFAMHRQQWLDITTITIVWGCLSKRFKHQAADLASCFLKWITWCATSSIVVNGTILHLKGPFTCTIFPFPSKSSFKLKASRLKQEFQKKSIWCQILISIWERIVPQCYTLDIEHSIAIRVMRLALLLLREAFCKGQVCHQATNLSIPDSTVHAPPSVTILILN